MGNWSRRIDRIERLVGATDCVCRFEDQPVACIVIEKGWDRNQIMVAESAAQFICPLHGRRSPTLIRLSPTDAGL
jgi:hypothetical protein